MTGWWFQPYWKILVKWDDSSQYMEKYKMFQTTNPVWIALHEFLDKSIFSFRKVIGNMKKTSMEWNIHKSSCQQILTYFTSQFISRSTRNQTPQIKSTDPSRAQLRSWPPPIRYVPSGLQWNPRGIEAKSHSEPVPMCHSAGFLFLALLVSAKGELRLEKTT